MSIPVSWRQIQRNSFTDWNALLSFLELDPVDGETILLKKSNFPLNLPVRLAEKIEKGRWDDPILRQFLPRKEEEIESPLFVLDPIADGAFRKEPKLLHKYEGRALLLCTSACAMHCRYCFRRHFPYETEQKLFTGELAAIRSDRTLKEILLSGGDPLSLSNAQLKALMESLSAIEHLKRIRFHTRFPMGIPERIDGEFLELLASCPKQIIFVIHCNHLLEFDEVVFDALKEVQKLGIPILSQSVLLRGVNDSVETLVTLFEGLVSRGILPYYLHQLDPVQGATHFEVSEMEGLEMMEALAARLPGYAVPKYVREIPHRPSKVQVTSCRVSSGRE
ncbi:MAG: KamA family radical SAM protein [Verrucomicrobia bacterium]|nr:KamA family radical SAM protein [Verrucomicrobiota bacterium]